MNGVENYSFEQQYEAVNVLATASDEMLSEIIPALNEREKSPEVRAIMSSPDNVRAVFRSTSTAMRRTGLRLGTGTFQEHCTLLETMLEELRLLENFSNSQLEALRASAMEDIHAKKLED